MTFTPPGPRPAPAAVVPATQLPPPPPRPGSRWLTALSPVVVAAGITGYVLAFDPNTRTLFPPCILKSSTGFDCPGCGGTRAFHALLHGDVVGALDHNIFILLVLPALLYLMVRSVAGSFGISLPWPRLRPAVAFGLVAFLIVFTVVRNIPGTPLYWLNSGTA